jgi:hypothetical protein
MNNKQIFNDEGKITHLKALEAYGSKFVTPKNGYPYVKTGAGCKYAYASGGGGCLYLYMIDGGIRPGGGTHTPCKFWSRCHTRFWRQIECKPCMCQNQNSRTQR